MTAPTRPPAQPVHLLLRDRTDLNAGLLRLRQWAGWDGLSEMDRTAAMTVAAELGRNIVKFAPAGALHVTRTDGTDPHHHHPLSRVTVLATDHGPGIPNIDWALADHHSTSRSLGLGLPGVKRLADEFEIESQAGAGTRVRACLHFRPHPCRAH